MKRFLLTALFFSVARLGAQTSAELFQTAYREATAATERKDYPAMLIGFRTADSIRPNTYTVMYNLAASYALNGQTDKAARALERALWINTSRQFETDSDFVALWPSPAYKRVLTVADSLSKPIHRAERAFELDDPSFHPEGIAFDPKTGRWFVGSIRQGTIVVREHDGNLRKDFLRSGGNNYSVMGMRIDAERRKLWIATSAMPEMEKFTDSLDGKAAVLRVNADNGQIEKIYMMPGKHVFGDLVVTSSGDVYISDSRDPLVCKIDAKTDHMTEFVRLQSAWNLQGIDLTPNGQYLIAADYISGLYRITLKDATIRKIEIPNLAVLRGIDGMYVHGHSILGIQNGVKPMRVSKFELDKDFTKIRSFEFLENGTEFLAEPTLGTITPEGFYFIANSPWGAYSRDGKFDVSKAQKPVIMKLKLMP